MVFLAKLFCLGPGAIVCTRHGQKQGRQATFQGWLDAARQRKRRARPEFKKQKERGDAALLSSIESPRSSAQRGCGTIRM
jgi:hypothetical protein